MREAFGVGKRRMQTPGGEADSRKMVAASRLPEFEAVTAAKISEASLVLLPVTMTM